MKLYASRDKGHVDMKSNPTNCKNFEQQHPVTPSTKQNIYYIDLESITPLYKVYV